MASLQPKVIYGLKTGVIGNAHYITDAEILYPVGNVLSIHNIPHRQQKLIPLPDKRQINIIHVTHNKKYVAFCEIGDKPTISIYDIQTLKKKKSLGIPYEATDVTNFTCIDFSYDDKYLTAVTDSPDQTMLHYNWEKGKVESTFKLANPQNPLAIVKCVSCNPGDGGIVALGGSRTFKFLTVSETIWHPYGFSKADNIFVCSMCWLNNDRLLLGTRDGRFLYMENGDLKNIFKADDVTIMNLKTREEYVIQQAQRKASVPQTNLESIESGNWENEIRCLISFPKGFAYGYGSGTIVVFEKEGLHKYVKRNLYKTPVQSSKEENPHLYRINAMNVNLSSDRIIVTTGWSQLFYATLWGADLQMDPEPQIMKIMGQSLHYGPIAGLSICAWKSVFMTCGEIDRTVRLWDFESENLIMLKQYAEDICGIALHPTGLFCLIGFIDKLRFMIILIDDLTTMQEFPIRNCQTIKFSNSGHLFAAVNGNMIHVYVTISFNNNFTLKGHTGRIKTLVWSLSDTKLLSMGSEGAIYQWDMTTGLRVGEIILKRMIVHDIAYVSDENSFYCLSNDRRIREIKEDTIMREHNISKMDVLSMTMGKDDSTLFVVSPGGVILSLKCPLQDPVIYMNFHIHDTDITQMALSYNEKYLISTSEDGGLCIWKLHDPDSKLARDDKQVVYTGEVLIGRNELQDKITTIEDLSFRIKEMETEHSYKTRQTDTLHNDQVRQLHQEYREVIEELKDKIVKNKDDHTHQINDINMDINKMKDAHQKSMKDMEINYEAKLMVEYEKYQGFEERAQIIRNDYEQRLNESEKLRIEELNKTIEKYNIYIEEKDLHLKGMQEEISRQARMQEQLLLQTEDDADKEIIELRTGYERRLYKESQTNLKLKGDFGLMKNKYMAGQKDNEDLKRKLHNLQGEYSNFEDNIEQLKNEVTLSKEEIVEKDKLIEEKERNINELNCQNEELEKIRLVLNHNIKELKEQIEPRDEEIEELKNKIRGLKIELDNHHKTIKDLDRQILSWGEKSRATKKELSNVDREEKSLRYKIEKMCREIADVATLIQEPRKLKTAVTKLYHKYGAGDEFLRTREKDLQVECEFIRQRDHLERTIISLKKRIVINSASCETRFNQMLKDNILLIEEMNLLREELINMTQLQRVLGIKSTDPIQNEAKQKLEQISQGYENMRNDFELRLKDCHGIIEALKDECDRLSKELETMRS